MLSASFWHISCVVWVSFSLELCFAGFSRPRRNYWSFWPDFVFGQSMIGTGGVGEFLGCRSSFLNCEIRGERC